MATGTPSGRGICDVRPICNVAFVFFRAIASSRHFALVSGADSGIRKRNPYSKLLPIRFGRVLNNLKSGNRP
jgi:hypothetical protein